MTIILTIKKTKYWYSIENIHNPAQCVTLSKLEVERAIHDTDLMIKHFDYLMGKPWIYPDTIMNLFFTILDDYQERTLDLLKIAAFILKNTRNRPVSILDTTLETLVNCPLIGLGHGVIRFAP